MENNIPKTTNIVIRNSLSDVSNNGELSKIVKRNSVIDVSDNEEFSKTTNIDKINSVSDASDNEELHKTTKSNNEELPTINIVSDYKIRQKEEK